MTKYLQLVGLEGKQMTVSRPIDIVSKRRKHLGPTIEFAKVTLHVEPADAFEVCDLVSIDSGAGEFGYPDRFIEGLLEILTSDRAKPLTRIRITLESAEFNAVESSPQAFFEAGRDAGRQLIESQATSL